jgi:hypothetical protein
MGTSLHFKNNVKANLNGDIYSEKSRLDELVETECGI